MRVREAMAARSQQSPGMGDSHQAAVLNCSWWGTCVPMLGRTWGSLGSRPLNLWKRPRNLGKPAPTLIARACPGLQEGGVGAKPEGMGMGNSYGKNIQNPLGPTQRSLADICAGGSIHDELGVGEHLLQETQSPVSGPAPRRNWNPATPLPTRDLESCSHSSPRMGVN